MLIIVLWLIFILSALLLVAVILLQEPKGGGLAEAFGGMGAQTFGVKATGITKFTAYVAVAFLLSGILLTKCHGVNTAVPFDETPSQEAPLGPGEMIPAETDTTSDTPDDE